GPFSVIGNPENRLRSRRPLLSRRAVNRKDIVLPFRKISRGGTNLWSSRLLSRAARLAAAVAATWLLAGWQALWSLSTGGEIKESAFRPSESRVTVDSVSRNNRRAELARAQHPRILATY